MKVIDLLNRIANGEEVPKKIKYEGRDMFYCEPCKIYELEEVEKGELCGTDLYNILDNLNDEVEIIEEDKQGLNMKEDLLKIINTYGIENQLKYIHSEYFELDEAILNYITRDEDREHIAEELSDCFVMLKQFQYYYGIEDKDIEEIMKYKIKRQLERIDKE